VLGFNAALLMAKMKWFLGCSTRGKITQNESEKCEANGFSWAQLVPMNQHCYAVLRDLVKTSIQDFMVST